MLGKKSLNNNKKPRFQNSALNSSLLQLTAALIVLLHHVLQFIHLYSGHKYQPRGKAEAWAPCWGCSKRQALVSHSL